MTVSVEPSPEVIHLIAVPPAPPPPEREETLDPHACFPPEPPPPVT